MPKVKQVVARKDYPEFGITRGQSHYFWSLKTGPRSSRTCRSLTKPKPSQLTTSEYLQQAYSLEEQIAAIQGDNPKAFIEELEEIKSDIENLKDEQQEKLDNMESNAPGLAQGPTGELLQSRIDACDAVVDSVGTAIDELQELADEDDESESEATVSEKIQSILSDISWEWE